MSERGRPGFSRKSELRSRETEGAGGKRGEKAPAKRETGILKTWRGRAWDTSVYSDQLKTIQILFRTKES